MKESHVASAISTVQTSKNYIPNMPQASRTAPPRPFISATRPAPPAPAPPALPPKNDATSLTADLRARNKAQGPATTNIVPQRSESTEQARQQERQEQLRQQEIQRQQEQRAQEEQRRHQEEKQRQIQLQQQQQQEQQRRLEQQKVEPVRPQLPPSKSSPATTFPATHPAQGAAGSTTGPPPVLPLQPTKKVQIQQQEKPPKPSAPAGGVAAAAAALEKPKEKEKRISTMTEVQIMEKLRQVVSDDDPKLLYSKIKKVGQGYVSIILFFSSSVLDGNATLPFSSYSVSMVPRIDMLLSPFFGCRFVLDHMK